MTLSARAGNQQFTGPPKKLRQRSSLKHSWKETCLPACMENHKPLNRTDGYIAGELYATNWTGVKKWRRLFNPKCKRGADFPTKIGGID